MRCSNHLSQSIAIPFHLLLPFLGPCAGQRELQTDVAFVAGIFYELFLIRQSPHYDFDAPKPRPSTGVLDGEAVKKMVFIQALPALD